MCIAGGIHSRLASRGGLRKILPLDARVVEWQTRTFEGRMQKGTRVQVPPPEHDLNELI
jgi:hypothetical protein